MPAEGRCRIAVFTDTHIGYKHTRVSREENTGHLNVLDECLFLSKVLEADLVIHTGDIFDFSTVGPTLLLETVAVMWRYGAGPLHADMNDRGDTFAHGLFIKNANQQPPLDGLLQSEHPTGAGLFRRMPFILLSGNHDYKDKALGTLAACGACTLLNSSFDNERQPEAPRSISIYPNFIVSNGVLLVVFALGYQEDLRSSSNDADNAVSATLISPSTYLAAHKDLVQMPSYTLLLLHQDVFFPEHQSSTHFRPFTDLSFVREYNSRECCDPDLGRPIDMLVCGHEHDTRRETSFYSREEASFGDTRVLQPGSQHRRAIESDARNLSSRGEDGFFVIMDVCSKSENDTHHDARYRFSSTAGRTSVRLRHFCLLSTRILHHSEHLYHCHSEGSEGTVQHQLESFVNDTLASVMQALNEVYVKRLAKIRHSWNTLHAAGSAVVSSLLQCIVDWFLLCSAVTTDGLDAIQRQNQLGFEEQPEHLASCSVQSYQEGLRTVREQHADILKRYDQLSTVTTVIDKYLDSAFPNANAYETELSAFSFVHLLLRQHKNKLTCYRALDLLYHSLGGDGNVSSIPPDDDAMYSPQCPFAYTISSSAHQNVQDTITSHGTNKPPSLPADQPIDASEPETKTEASVIVIDSSTTEYVTSTSEVSVISDESTECSATLQKTSASATDSAALITLVPPRPLVLFKFIVECADNERIYDSARVFASSVRPRLTCRFANPNTWMPEIIVLKSSLITGINVRDIVSGRACAKSLRDVLIDALDASLKDTFSANEGEIKLNTTAIGFALAAMYLRERLTIVAAAGDMKASQYNSGVRGGTNAGAGNCPEKDVVNRIRQRVEISLKDRVTVADLLSKDGCLHEALEAIQTEVLRASCGEAQDSNGAIKTDNIFC